LSGWKWGGGENYEGKTKVHGSVLNIIFRYDFRAVVIIIIIIEQRESKEPIVLWAAKAITAHPRRDVLPHVRRPTQMFLLSRTTH
jgi:hypothetical protein